MGNQLMDFLEPVTIRVVNSSRSMAQKRSTLTAEIYKKGIEIDLKGIQYVYEWFFTSFDPDGCTDKPFGIGKHLAINSEELGRHCNFEVRIRETMNKTEMFYTNPVLPTI